MARKRDIHAYLARFQRDIEAVPTRVGRAQVCRIYHHEPWMGNWRCHYAEEQGQVFASRIHRRTRRAQWAFPNQPSDEVMRWIMEHHVPGNHT